MPIETDLEAKTFGMNDQASFARWSGDHNPMHVSALAARRLLSGRPVVHGVHTVLEALARWAPHASGPCAQLQADFLRPINVDDAVRFAATVRDDGVCLTATVEGQLHMRLMVLNAPAAAPSPTLPEGHGLSLTSDPLDHAPATWLGATHILPPVVGALPVAERMAEWLGRPAVAGLGQLSTLVGMACPGLHSIFSSFDLQPGRADEQQRFRALRHEPRFRLVDIEVDGPWRGRLRAFVRPPPQPQPSMASLLDRVLPQAHRGAHAWVLGGSRGLGELTAKLLAAGGADVSLSYATGQDDAMRVADEINQAGRGRASVTGYRVGETPLAELCARLPRPAAVFYFATPRIGRKRDGLFDSALLSTFLRCYVDEPAALALALEGRYPAEEGHPAVQLVNPSTVFVDELPAGMAEYAMAKSAAEVLARDFNKRLKGVRMHAPRLPRVMTDQTAGIMPSQAADAVAVMQPLVAALLQGP